MGCGGFWKAVPERAEFRGLQCLYQSQKAAGAPDRLSPGGVPECQPYALLCVRSGQQLLPGHVKTIVCEREYDQPFCVFRATADPPETERFLLPDKQLCLFYGFREATAGDF